MPTWGARGGWSSPAHRGRPPPCFADSSMSSRGHCCSVTPTTSWPCAWSSAAATDESTPPDMATAILTEVFPSPLAGEGQGGETRSSFPVVHDLLGDNLPVLTHPIENRRLRLALAVHA